jgi:transposase
VAAEVAERLRQAPGEEARTELGLPDDVPPSRWQVRTIRASVPSLADYTLSGVWRLLQRSHLRLRSAHGQLYSPDPDYQTKVDRLCTCLREAALHPETIVFLFLDEMGYYRWPDPAPEWSRLPPVATRDGTNRQQRLVGALNALTGRVDYLDAYIIGREKVGVFYRQLDAVYPQAKTIYVAQDNWSIHRHPDVLAVLETVPRIQPIWLPTYAPWLNPIEKLWRWLRQSVLKLHRLTLDFPALRQRVNTFLDHFAAGSQDLLHYVGLQGEGKLADCLKVA